MIDNQKNAGAFIPAKFAHFYRQQTAQIVRKLEIQRIMSIIWAILMYIIFLPLVVCAFLMSFKIIKISSEIVINPEVLGIIGIVLLMFVTIVSPLKMSGYEFDAKSLMFNKILSFLGSFEYSSYVSDYSRIPAEYLKSLCLFDDFDDYKVKSIIEGKYNGIDAKIEDIILKNKVEYKPYYLIKSKQLTIELMNIPDALCGLVKTIKSNINAAKGIFMMFSFQKEINGKVLISQNKRIINTNKVKNLHKVQIASSEFNRLFIVYSDNPESVKDFLTQDFMQRLVYIAKKYSDLKISCSFEGKQLNVFIQGKFTGCDILKNWCKVSVWKSIDRLREYQNQVGLIASFLSLADTANFSDEAEI